MTLSRPEHLAGLVVGMSPPARSAIVRESLRAFSAEEHSEWLALGNARRQRDHYNRQKAAKPNDSAKGATVSPGHEPNDTPEVRTIRGTVEPNDAPQAPTVRETPPLPPGPPTRTPTSTGADAPARGEAGSPQEETATRYKDGSLKSRPADLDAVFVRTRQLSLPDPDAEWLWAKWCGNGFKNDGKAMKDWRQVVRASQLNGYLPSLRQGRNRPPAAGPNGHGKPQDQRRYVEETF